MSEAGKPIYTRYGDEEVLSPFFATMSAIIPKLQSYFVVQAEKEQSNQLRWFDSKIFKCAILKKGNLFYICLTSTKSVPKTAAEFIDEKY